MCTAGLSWGHHPHSGERPAHVILAQLQRLYRDLFQFQERNTLTFYLMFSGSQVLAFLTSIIPASTFGVLAGMVFGLVIGFTISGASILVSALIAFVFARYFFRTASCCIAARRVSTFLSGWRRGFQGTVGDTRLLFGRRRSLRSVLPVTASV